MNEIKHNSLDTDKIGSLIFRLSIPAFIGMAVQTLYNIVNTIFIGRYVGAYGIAGPSLVFPIQMLAMGFSMMMGMGGASVISRALGAGNKEKANLTLANAMAGVLSISFFMMIVIWADMDFWLRLVGASSDTLPYARDYLSVILSGVFLQTSSMCLSNMVMAEGNARTVMIGQAIGAISNIILDAIFIVGLHMGVKGAALGTIIAQFLSTVYFLRYYISGSSTLKFIIRYFIFRWQVMKEIMSIGVSSLGSTLVTSLSMIVINRMLVVYSGDYAVSAYGIVNRLVMFVIMPGIAIGQSLQPILGFNYGMKNYGRAIKSIKIAVFYSTIISMAAFLILFFFPEIFVSIFTGDTQLIDLAVRSMKYIFSTLPLVGFIMVGTVVFQAVGKARQAFITSMARSCFFLFPAVLILPRFFQLEGVWLAWPVTDFLSAILIVIFLIPLLREFKKGEAGMLSSLHPVVKTTD